MGLSNDALGHAQAASEICNHFLSVTPDHFWTRIMALTVSKHRFDFVFPSGELKQSELLADKAIRRNSELM